MSTANATGDLLTRRELIRRFDGPHPVDTDQVGEIEVAAEERALFVAGTVCLANGQPDLWKAIYSAVSVLGNHGDTALAEYTAAARRGDL